GRDPDGLEWVGGVRGRFTDQSSPADLDEALDQMPHQVSRGFGSICIKPSQFIDSIAELPRFCEQVVRRSAEAVG
ncbi:MAG TPA: F420-dependent oxidoreductase, partial [Acidimicrobiia bacterium]|nr:F420-dependent oxidoreductase [Acidimicrobiia bacterium]